jgi:ATP-dependent DNA helicase RecQ
MLQKLHDLQFLFYSPRKEIPQLVMVSERLASKDLRLSNEVYADRKKSAAKRIQAVIDFVRNDEVCRSVQLLAYFGETHRKRCGKCDVCIKRNSVSVSDVVFQKVRNKLFQLMANRPVPVFEAAGSVEGVSEEKVLEVIRWLTDNGLIIKDKNGYLKSKTQLDIDD